MASELARLTGFLYEQGLLKRYSRTGWHIVGVRSPESIADHSYRTAVIATVLAAMEGAVPERAGLLALFHDSQETRLTDVPYVGKRYLTAAPNRAVTADQTRGMPEAVAKVIQAVVDEYEERESPEAVCARDADKLECLIQALEYREQGHQNVQSWIDSSLAALRTSSAKALAHEALHTGSLDWLERALNGEGDREPGER